MKIQSNEMICMSNPGFRDCVRRFVLSGRLTGRNLVVMARNANRFFKERNLKTRFLLYTEEIVPVIDSVLRNMEDEDIDKLLLSGEPNIAFSLNLRDAIPERDSVELATILLAKSVYKGEVNEVNEMFSKSGFPVKVEL